uniref:Thiamine diphosphokinase n=1 Tax=Prevotella sp. GTC17259 TaxID=3236795 RepID=A0AB33J5X9_9BACT
MDYPLITPETEFDAIILAAGDFPTHPLPLTLLAHAKYICCCDGAAAEYVGKGYMPNAIVGDGDSLPNKLKQQYANILHEVAEQDSNDLTKATRHCIGMGFRHIAYLGATGKREDHSLANISLMMHYYRNMGIAPTMITDHGVFIPTHGNRTFGSKPGQQISIFNFGCNHIESKGLKWQSFPYEHMWQGTLNEAVGTEIQFCADNYYMVFRCFP